MMCKNGLKFAIIAMVTFLFSSFSIHAGQASGSGQELAPPDEAAYSRNQPAEIQSVPPVMILPAGTLVMVRTTQTLSSDHNKVGEGFSTILDQPIVSQGWVVARRGQVVVGRIAAAQSAGRKQGSSQLAIELVELMLVDGQQLPIRTELAQMAAGGSRTVDKVAVIGTTTGLGAAIGGAAAGGDGAGIGAAIGAVAGIAGIMMTPGKPTEIYPETQLIFRLEEPVEFSTRHSQQAFLRITQEDYTNRAARNPYRYPETRTYSAPPVYNYPPVQVGVYLTPYHGYYGSYGYYNHRYYGGSRVYIRPGNRWHH
jgi:hypothetical protein